MTKGIQVQSQAPGTAGIDLGFWLQSQIIGQPVAMTERHLTNLVEQITANRFTLQRNRSTGARITEKGTAILEIHGVLINRSPLMSSYWGLTAYEGLTEQFRRLASNADVKRIVLDIDSPGGLVSGIRSCAEALEELAEKKPVFALAHDMACSAGYWIAACAQEISATPDAELGSIGVRSGHVSYAEMLEREGIQVRGFAAGATKLDGSISRLIGDGQAAEIQFDIDRIYDRFCSHVARCREMSEAAVKRTDARTFIGEDAVEAGLADRIETLEDMVDRLERDAPKVRPKRKLKTEPSSKGGLAPDPKRTPAPPDTDGPSAGAPSKRGARLMTEATTTAGAEALAAAINEYLKPTAALPTPVVPAAPAADTSAANTAAAVAAEQARIFAILNCDDAKDRPAMAKALAQAGLSADQAKGILAASPAEAAAKADEGDKGLENGLAREMAKKGNAANVKPDAAGGGVKPSLSEKFAKKFETTARKV